MVENEKKEIKLNIYVKKFNNALPWVINIIFNFIFKSLNNYFRLLVQVKLEKFKGDN